MWDFFSTVGWVGLFVFAGWYFRAELRGVLVELRALIGRTRKGPGGTEFDPQGPPIGLEATTKAGPAHPAVEVIVKGAMVQHGTPDAALRGLAAAVVELVAASVYATIFGSQVQLLLDCQRRGKVRVDEARPYYDTATKANPALYANYTFEQWFTWLITAGLIAREVNTLSLTPMGDALLVYRQWRNLPLPAN